jgi:hypothetical protein
MYQQRSQGLAAHGSAAVLRYVSDTFRHVWNVPAARSTLRAPSVFLLRHQNMTSQAFTVLLSFLLRFFKKIL